ncbi:MAG TPA: flagellar basal-body rod protein FlgG [Pirellulales bacterium]|jgi:flagellar basal-body rod protein FlgG|nr:flagellar basal-body rod protein FlgG [Pirellulales bacterium]
MGLQTLYTAATGMDALQTKLDTISNNLANVNTTGFKQDRCNFEDLMYQNPILPGNQDSAGQFTPTGIHVGLGVRVQSTQADFSQGSFQQTGRPLDWAVVGDGFFQVTDPSGQIYYSRAGNFSLNANGQIVLASASDGRLLDPAITIPQDAVGIVVSPEGLVSVQQANTPQLQQVGQIQLARFINPQGLLKMGQNLFQETVSSGSPLQGNPGTPGFGTIQQNALENSNVNPVTQLIDLITTQRAFELNSQAVQTGNQVLQLIDNLQRV